MCGDHVARYLHALRFALSNQANPYGFTLVGWATGALATSQLGKPDPAAVFAYLGGALVSASLIVAGVIGFRHPFVLRGVGGSFTAVFVAVALYQLLLAAEVAVAIVPGRRRAKR